MDGDKLESRIARLPEKIESGLDAQKIARLLSESLRQNFLESGLPAAARCLQGTSADDDARPEGTLCRARQSE